jgi:hypothetical protein
MIDSHFTSLDGQIHSVTLGEKATVKVSFLHDTYPTGTSLTTGMEMVPVTL